MENELITGLKQEMEDYVNEIISMSELVLAGNINENQKRYMSDIKISAGSLLEIISCFEPEPKQCNLKELVEGVCAMITVGAEEKGLEFICEQEIPDCVYIDNARLRQVLMNILGNAVKFTERGCVKLRVKVTESSIVFLISDTGIGIRTEDSDKLFLPFERLDEKQNREIAGTGLGLFISAKLVKQMKGTIQVESIYGEGSSFRIEIPIN